MVFLLCIYGMKRGFHVIITAKPCGEYPYHKTDDDRKRIVYVFCPQKGKSQIFCIREQMMLLSLEGQCLLSIR